MKITDKQAKEIIEICNNPDIYEYTKINLIRLITNNDIEMLLDKIKMRLKD